MIALLLTLALARAEEPTPSPSDTAFEAAVEALKAGKAPHAEAMLEGVVEGEPTRAEAWWELGWARWAQGDFAGAATAWTEVQGLDPGRAELEQWLSAARSRASLAGVARPPADVPLEAAAGRVRFAAGGDTMMGTALRKGEAGLAAGNGEGIFEGVDAVLRAADVAFLNLEGPLADDHLPQTKCGPTSKHCYAFRTPTRYVAAATSGCCLNINDVDDIVAAVAQADQDADIVVLSFHGAAEGSSARHVPEKLEIGYGERRGDVMAVARAAIDAGADLVLGHGPHVLRAMEVYRGRLVAYSLGNFCGYNQFGTEGGYGGTSMVLQADLAANGVLLGATVVPVALDGLGQPRLDPAGAAIGQLNELSAADFPQTGVTVAADGTVAWPR